MESRVLVGKDSKGNVDYLRLVEEDIEADN